MNTDITPSSCPGCHTCALHLAWHDRDRRIYRCVHCGLLFVFPQPSQESLHSTFQSEYFVRGRAVQQTRLDLEFDVWRQPMLRRIAAEIIARQQGGVLLDIGCAGGALFGHFPSDRWQLYGIEPSALAYEHAKKHTTPDSHIHLFNGYLSDAQYPPAFFDAITILESLYYMPNPHNELATISHVLKQRGLLAIEIPGYYYHRLLRTGLLSYLLSRSWCSLPHSHLFYFSRRSLSELLRQHGLYIADSVALETSMYGSRLIKTARHTLVGLAQVLFALSAKRLDVAPRILYLCQKHP